MTSYGKRACHQLVEPLAQAGVCIVSGLAYGIDAEAHKATLNVGGTTLAVLAGGIDDATLYPRHHVNLAHDILNSGGALISEHPPCTEYRKHHFPIRNRIIAGLSNAVLVVEASIKSGTLITARAAIAENRDVLAVPGPIDAELSKGPHMLIQDGATAIFSPDDIFCALGLEEVADTTNVEASGIEKSILKALAREPIIIDNLAAKLSIPISELSHSISMLELRGLVAQIGNGQIAKT